MLPPCPKWLTRYVDVLLRGVVSGKTRKRIYDGLSLLWLTPVRRFFTYLILLVLGLLLAAPFAFAAYVIWVTPPSEWADRNDTGP